MRKVFSSQRFENVERVAEMLRAEDIEVRIKHGRSYTGNAQVRSSYQVSRQRAQPAELWVVHSDSYKKAREVMFEAGLLEEKMETQYSLSSTRSRGVRGVLSWQKRIRLILIGSVLIVGVLTAYRGCQQNQALQQSEAAPQTNDQAEEPQEEYIPIYFE